VAGREKEKKNGAAASLGRDSSHQVLASLLFQKGRRDKGEWVGA
jgi:hypothetical protein